MRISPTALHRHYTA